MKISLQWLADYLPGPLDAQTAADALTNGGLPVEVIETIGNHTVIDVEVTSNRGDCLSHVGVARELAALLNRPFKDVELKPLVAEATRPPDSAPVAVRIEAPDLCPHYTARVIRGVKVGPSPAWMQERLVALGLRPINNVVDVTNYVMFELGQPLHAFDYDKVGGNQIVVRRAAAGETLVTIDGKTAELRPDYLAIADAAKPVALAGVMGGKASEVTDGTVNVLLESARFDPLAVRKAARAIVRSDSSYRFERGLDPLLAAKASQRAAQLIVELAGGQVVGPLVEAGSAGHTPKRLTLRLARLKQVLGVEFPPAQVVEALNRLQLSPVLVGDAAGADAAVQVTVPSYRLDLNIEVDLVEEVARIIGYDKVPVRDEIAIRVVPADPRAKAVEVVRDALVAGGYFEAVTVGFVSDLLAADFVPPDADKADPLPRASAVTRKGDAALRPSILPGLLESVRRNDHAGNRDAKLFEIGSTFYNATAGAGGAADAGPTLVEQQKLGLVGSPDVREVRGVVEAVLAKLDATRAVTVIPEHRAGYARGACGRVEWGGRPVGQLGRIAKDVCDKLGLRDRPAAAELDVATLLAGAQLVPQLKPLPAYPAAERDLSLVVADTVRYEAIASLVRSAELPNLESLSYVTTYRGKPLEKGSKSVTLRFVFRSESGTLTSDQVEQAVGQVVDRAKRDLAATLRA